MPVMQGVTPRKGRGAKHVRRFLYDFAVQGGAVSAITLTDEDGRAATIPDNAVVSNARTEVITALTSSGAATVKLGITGNDDAFLAATAYSDGTLNTADDVATRAAELPLKTAAAVSVLATIAGAALTAGKFVVEVEYTEGA